MVVYKLSFEVAGENINYKPYQGGYYIAPIEGGTGSLILLTATGTVKTYYTYANFGELFVAVKGAARKTVLSATAANSVSTTTFFAIGTAKTQMSIATRAADLDVWVAETLKGYAVSADSERDLPYASTSATDIGVAGVSYITATLDDAQTKDAIATNATLALEVTAVQTMLQELGYVAGTVSNTTATGTGTGTATGTNATTGTGTAAPGATTGTGTTGTGATGNTGTTTTR